jgi:hypothetical protein
MTYLTSGTSPLSLPSETAVSGSRRARAATHPGVSAPLLGGLFFVALAAGFIWFGLDYKLGTPRSMGPGMFPVMGGVLLALLGVALAATSLRNRERVTGIAWWPLVATIGSVAVFALLIERTGLAIAAPILVGGVVLATGNGWKTAVALAVPLTIAAIVVFPTLLGVPLKVLP